MSYAINSTNTGWRAINSQDDLLPGETYSETHPQLVIPVGPLTCTPFQIRAALTKLNLRASVEAAVSASTDQSVKDAWQYAQQFIENDPFIVSMATQLGQTSDQIHQLFQLAQTLQS
jgi:hypothetical protein